MEMLVRCGPVRIGIGLGGSVVRVRAMGRWQAMKKKARENVPEEEVRKMMEQQQKKASKKASNSVYMGSLGNVADSYIPGVSEGGLMKR